MRTSPLTGSPILAGLLLLGASAAAQPTSGPRTGYVYPAGGQRGTTFEVAIGGQGLEGASGLDLSGDGLTARILEYRRPLTPRELTLMRDRIDQLRQGEGTSEARREIDELRRKIAANNRNVSPAIAEVVTAEVTVAPRAALGDREIRVMTPRGLSTPLVFRIGLLPERTEAAAPPRDASPADTPITLPAVLNGRIVPRAPRSGPGPKGAPAFTPGDADVYRFEARAGQKLVVAVSARELTPYLADAVPGWFQATATLRDAEGREVAYADDFEFRPDPVLACEVPHDGEYVLTIQDALFRGREDFVYRATVGELPLVTGVFPMGTRTGTKARVELVGWNLRDTHLTVDAKHQAPGLHPLVVPPGLTVIGGLAFAVDSRPESPEKPHVKLPLVVNGRVGGPRERDAFQFDGRAGQTIVAEVQARRLGSPLDAVLALEDANGRRVAWNDDHEDRAAGLCTHHADPWLLATLPATGRYVVTVADAQQRGGTAYTYRLRLGAPQPDFALRVVPSSINAAAGTTVPLTVYAIRKDGFAGDITLALDGAPRGFRLSGAVLPAGQDSVRLTLTVPPDPGGPVSLRMVGRGTAGGQAVERVAAAADEKMQAFAYRHLVVAQDLRATVTGAARRGPNASGPRFIDDRPLQVPAGGVAWARLDLPDRRRFPGTVHFELSEPPEGLTLPESLPANEAAGRPEGPVIVVRSDAQKVKPGQRGNLIVTVIGERAPESGGGGPTGRRRVTLATLPALPFEIVGP
jgi:hypothetical protein